jgi:hypothetical protein
MKNLICTLCILLSCAYAQAQNCIIDMYSYHAPMGGSSTVNVYLQVDTTLPGPIPVITGYSWSTGETTSSIVVNTSGIYCVTATVNNGCTTSACMDVTVNPLIGPCTPQISVVGNPTTGYVLNSFIAGVDSTTVNYLWSTGSTSSTIATNIEATYCVTMTVNNTTCVAITCTNLQWDTIDCALYLTQDAQGNLIADGWGELPLAYVWSDGTTGNGLLNPVFGQNYCVTMTDASGCSKTKCIFAIDPVQSSCSVNLWQSPSTGNVQANYGGSAPLSDVTFTWSDPMFGDTNIINPGFFWNSLCVTITTPNGCSQSDCIYNNYSNQCIWNINYERVDDETFKVYPFGPFGANATYLWSNGATTDTIIIDQAGVYAVTVTGDCSGAQDSIYFDWSSDLRVSASNIMFNGEEDLRVWLIKYDEAAGTLTAEAEAVNELYTNMVHFDDIPDGSYLIKGAPNPNSPDYLDKMPTYYKSRDEGVLFWNEAKPVKFPSLIPGFFNGRRAINLNFVAGQNPGGPGFVGGLISNGANLIGEADDRSDEDPLYGASIIIFDANGNVVAGLYTDHDGAFQIPNLAYGTYKVVVDHPGMEQYTQWITLSPAQGSAYVEVEMQAASSSTQDQQLITSQRLEIWPNPVTTHQLWVNMPANGRLNMLDMNGKNLSTHQLTAGKQSVQLGQLPEGFYLAEVRTATGIFTQKVFVTK